MYSISRRYGLTVEQLRTYNNIGKNAAIRPGQKLKLSPP
jgi:LysM repeat protein